MEGENVGVGGGGGSPPPLPMKTSSICSLSSSASNGSTASTPHSITSANGMPIITASVLTRDSPNRIITPTPTSLHASQAVQMTVKSHQNTNGGPPPLPPKSVHNGMSLHHSLPRNQNHTTPVTGVALLGAVPPAPVDPFVPIQKSAAGTPLPPIGAAGIGVPGQPYGSAWNCSTGPRMSMMQVSMSPNTFQYPPPPSSAPVALPLSSPRTIIAASSSPLQSQPNHPHPTGHQLSSGSPLALISSSAVPSEVHTHSQTLPHKKASKDLIDLDINNSSSASWLTNGCLADGDVLDLFDPLRIDSVEGGSTPSSTEDKEDNDDSERGGTVGIIVETESPDHEKNTSPGSPPRVRPVPAERESLKNRKGDSKPCYQTEDTIESNSGQSTSPTSVNELIAQWNEQRLKSFEGVRVIKRNEAFNSDLEIFWRKCKQLRSEFSYDDHLTNAGLVVSPTLDTRWPDLKSVRMEITTPLSEKPFCFTCDVATTVQHVISQVVCSLGMDDKNMDNYVLKVKGRSEYLTADSQVKEYEYAHWCFKFDKPICLSLIGIEDLRRPWQRVLSDDAQFLEVNCCDLLVPEANVKLDDIAVLMDTFRCEAKKLLNKQNARILPNGVIQAVKAICARLSRIETPDIINAIQGLERLCGENESLAVSPAPDVIEVQRRTEVLTYQLVQIQKSLEKLLMIYSATFPVDFSVVLNSPKQSPEHQTRREVTQFGDTVLFHVGSIYQPKADWLVSYDTFILKCQLIYGRRIIHQVEDTRGHIVEGRLFQKIAFDVYLEFDLAMRRLPRESSIYVTLYGVSKEDVTRKPRLAWFGLNMFSSKRELIQGTKLCSFWGPEVDKSSGPACCNDSPDAPVLMMQFTEFDGVVFFPKVCHEKAPAIDVELDPREEQRIREKLDKDPLCSLIQNDEDKKFFWDRRHFIRKLPQLLPKVLLSCETWSWLYLKDIYALVREWVPQSHISALTLLLPQFPDSEVRRIAVSWIKNVGSDELCDHLPQLVQALRFEAWEDSPVTWFLLERALTSTRVAHQMYWLLKQNEENLLSRRRVKMMMNALTIISGQAFSNIIHGQIKLLQGLRYAADMLKRAKEGDRLNTVLHNLKNVNAELQEYGALCLPLNPSLEVASIDVKNCSYYTSNTLPLKVNFKNIEPSAAPHDVIFKVGDDLRQDMLVLQMLRIMDKLWLKQGLDLKIITFECVPTGKEEGMVEVVKEAETLRKIQTEHGLTGSFKDKPIAEWLQKHNGSELDYRRAVENFSLSCAGYCVATYVLGICDRHNDNIMLKPSGHMFHIDFGKFLGDAQMFGTIKRDRVPFVLTSDMVYVINGGDKPSKDFQRFVDNCCNAFNILRANSNVIITLFGLMVSSGIPGLNDDAVHFVQKALLLCKSPTEAASDFTRLIEDSCSSKFTQMNFFIHNIAQMRFTGDHNDTLTLSFAPKVYTKQTDGRLIFYKVERCVRKNIPEKHYTYVIKLRRENENVDSYIHRTYAEFLEFHQKLLKVFPNAPLPPLSKGSLVGRSNTKDVAERRIGEIESFLNAIKDMAEEVAHCDLVYTFFHPLFRDQEGQMELQDQVRIHNELGIAGPSGRQDSNSAGKIKLDLTFANHGLSIMVMHAENLRCERKAAPDAYVKTYLKPDPDKQTKRKTRVASKNKHPTFMELVSYRYPYETLRTRVLEVSVWDYDRVQGNEMIGSVYIFIDRLDLSKPHIAWFDLSCVGKMFYN